MSYAFDRLEVVANRFAGYSLDYRRRHPDWPAPYRARLFTNKNERSEYRVTGYGDSAMDAIASALEQIKETDT